jgi:predicted enzyme related to lactoylglutathione lyase
MACPVVEWQIVARDPERAAAFYGALFGWTVDADNPLGYRRVRTGPGGIDGGIWPAPPQASAFVQLFVQVPSMAEAHERAVALGATSLIAPQTLPEGDELAILLDPSGLPFGLLWRASAAAGP